MLEHYVRRVVKATVDGTFDPGFTIFQRVCHILYHLNRLSSLCECIET